MKKVFVNIPADEREPEKVKKSIEKLTKIACAVFDEPELEPVIAISPELHKELDTPIVVLGDFCKKIPLCNYYIDCGYEWSSLDAGYDLIQTASRDASNIYGIKRFILSDISNLNEFNDMDGVRNAIYERRETKELTPVCTGDACPIF